MFIQLCKAFLGRQPGERLDVAEADARALIEQQIAVAVEDDPLVPAVQRAFDRALARLGDSLHGSVESALRTHLASPAGDRGLPFPPGRDDHAGGFRNLGEFALAVKAAATPGAAPYPRLLALQTKAPSGMSEGSGA